MPFEPDQSYGLGVSNRLSSLMSPENVLRNAQIKNQYQALQQAPEQARQAQELARRSDMEKRAREIDAEIAFGVQAGLPKERVAQRAILKAKGYGFDDNSIKTALEPLMTLTDTNAVKQHYLQSAFPEKYAAEAFKPEKQVADNWNTVNTDKGIMQVNPRTGQVRPLGIDAPERGASAGGDSQRGQIIFDNQGRAFNVNPYTNEVRPVNVGGQQIQGAQYSPVLQGDIAGARASGGTTGKALGEASAGLSDIESQMPQLEKLVSDLSTLGKKATYTKAGQYADYLRRQSGFGVGEGAIARKEYISKVDNEILPLLRQTFGAAFTQKEGETLKATLGDPDATPEEKDTILKSFIQTKKQQVESLKRRTAQPATQAMQSMPTPQSAAGRTVRDTSTGIRYKSDGSRWIRVE